MCDFFSGTVVHGLGKGKDFGFPTINIKLNDNSLHIENGVYAVNVIICIDAACQVSITHKGMLYAGTRPTLDLHEKTIEIHIIDFNEDIYEKQISFQILCKIRDEVHFESIKKLIEQLHQDKKMVYEYFQNSLIS
jgi:riboflavin kinase/FMN adenylyltransferase